ncbi:MAG: serine/threonine-protein phosphatase [Ruminococcus sp.]|nr:serine/threonine-protein phosphatase [Ruminococcus sp.]
MRSYYIFGLTDCGQYRDRNEDGILINHEVLSEGSYSSRAQQPFITAVCDGVGGENAGEIASDQCLRQLSLISYSSMTDIEREINIIHNKIKQRGVRLENAMNMQTTLCSLFIDEDGNALCVNIGDSRMYRYTDGEIRQISTDQSLAQYLYDDGSIDEFDELTPQMRATIISSVGSVHQAPKPQYVPLVTRIGDANKVDIIILCSDGVSDYVSIDEMQIILSMDTLFDDKIKMIHRLAQRNGSTDNMSVIGLISEDQLSEHDMAIAKRHEREKELALIMREARRRKNADLEELSSSSIEMLRKKFQKNSDEN